MEPVSLYITAANREEAILLSRELAGERLIACANIIENVTSIYWWQDEIEQHPEVVIIAKTLSSLVDRITAKVKGLHSYSCPCVVAMPVIGGNPEYIEWIRKEVKE